MQGNISILGNFLAVQNTGIETKSCSWMWRHYDCQYHQNAVPNKCYQPSFDAKLNPNES